MYRQRQAGRLTCVDAQVYKTECTWTGVYSSVERERERYTYVPCPAPSHSQAMAAPQKVSIYVGKHIVICGIAGPMPMAQTIEFLGCCCLCCLSPFLLCSFSEPSLYMISKIFKYSNTVSAKYKNPSRKRRSIKMVTKSLKI